MLKFEHFCKCTPEMYPPPLFRCIDTPLTKYKIAVPTYEVLH